jgi:hypothetical protein
MAGLGRIAGALIVTAGLLLGPAGLAHATTGPITNLPKTFTVKSEFAARFVGQYILKYVPAVSHIQSAAIGIEVNSNGYLYGIAQFYGYDPAGSQNSWVATLYHFKQVGKSPEMRFDILSSSLTITYGHMVVSEPTKGLLKGQIVLGKQSYPVVFHQVSR